MLEAYKDIGTDQVTLVFSSPLAAEPDPPVPDGFAVWDGETPIPVDYFTADVGQPSGTLHLVDATPLTVLRVRYAPPPNQIQGAPPGSLPGVPFDVVTPYGP